MIHKRALKAKYITCYVIAYILLVKLQETHSWEGDSYRCEHVIGNHDVSDTLLEVLLMVS